MTALAQAAPVTGKGTTANTKNTGTSGGLVAGAGLMRGGLLIDATSLGTRAADTRSTDVGDIAAPVRIPAEIPEIGPVEEEAPVVRGTTVGVLQETQARTGSTVAGACQRPSLAEALLEIRVIAEEHPKIKKGDFSGNFFNKILHYDHPPKNCSYFILCF